MEAPDSPLSLLQAWRRMEAICQKLWEEDRVSAVGLQAVIEEFRGQMEHAEGLLKSAQHNPLQKALQEERQRGEGLLLKLEETERALNDTKEQAFKKEAELDTRHASKMKELLEQLEKTEATEESFWSNIRKEWETERARQIRELEAWKKSWEDQRQSWEKEHHRRSEELRQKESALMASYYSLKTDLDAREEKAAQWEASIKHKEKELEEKLKEFERSKEDLKTKVGLIVQEYRAHLKQPV